MIFPLYINEDIVVILSNLLNTITQEYDNGATVSAQLTNAVGVNIGTAVTMSYVASSNGKYRGIIPDSSTSTLTDELIYYLEITITSSTINGFRKIRCKGKYRESN